MRSRSREVNIFNMSLLDILTGMLGAFLFLMLGLVPYYTRAHNGEGNGNKTPPVDTMLNVLSRWTSPAKIDFFLYDANTGWHGNQEKSLPLSRRAKISTGACPAGTGWQVASLLANPDQRYLLAYTVQGNANPESLRNILVSIELMEEESDPKGNGLKSYCPLTSCTSFDASGAKPGVLYSVTWVHVTKDASKGTSADYNLQYSFNLEDATARDKMPDGCQLAPTPAPIAVIPVMPNPSSGPSNSNTPSFPGFSSPGPSNPPVHSK